MMVETQNENEQNIENSVSGQFLRSGGVSAPDFKLNDPDSPAQSVMAVSTNGSINSFS